MTPNSFPRLFNLLLMMMLAVPTASLITNGGSGSPYHFTQIGETTGGTAGQPRQNVPPSPPKVLTQGTFFPAPSSTMGGSHSYTPNVGVGIDPFTAATTATTTTQTTKKVELRPTLTDGVRTKGKAF